MVCKILLPVSFLFYCNAGAQYVGIGTSNPQSTLDVRGNQRFGGINNFLSYDSGTGKIQWINSRLFLPNNQQLIQHSASAEGLYYSNSALEYRNQVGNAVFSTNWNTATGYFGGNVGIGTTTPAARLHIQNGISGFTPNNSNLIVETNGNNYISFLTPDNYQSAILFEKPAHLQSGGIYYNSPSSPDGLILRANNAPRMIISNSGSVGIGTSPQSRLHIVDGSSGYAGGYFPGITFEGSGNRYLDFITPSGNESGVLFGNNADAASGGIVYNSSGTNNGLQFRTNANIVRMVLTNAGFVAIGNTNPGYLLDVNGRMRIRSGGNNSISAGLWFNNNSNTEAAFIGMEDDTHVGIFGNNGAAWKFTMNTQTGALKVNGSEGLAGQVLASTGGGANTWVDKKEPSFYLYRQTDYQVIMRSDNNSPGEAVGWYVVGGMHNQTITINKTSTVIIQIRVPLHNPSNTFGGTGESELHFGLDDASNNYLEFDIAGLDVVDGSTGQAIAFGYRSNIAPGNYHTHVKIERFLTEDMAMGTYYTGADQGSLMIQVIPQ